MSSRERWTVYPLLFLTMGIALKDKVTREITTETVNCKSLLVTDRQGQRQLTLGRTQTGGLMSIQGRNGQGMLVGHANPWFGIVFVRPNGSLAPSILSGPVTPPLQSGGASKNGGSPPQAAEPNDGE